MTKYKLDFTTAQYRGGKTSYVEFYALDPQSQKLRRKRIKVNYIKDPEQRMIIAQQMIHEINSKLFTGWNPFTDTTNANAQASLLSAINLYRRTYMPRNENSYRSYHSILNHFEEYAAGRKFLAKPCSQITKDTAITYLKDLLHVKQLAPKTHNNYKTILCAVFNKLMAYGYTEANPFAGIPKMSTRGKNRDVIDMATITRITEYFAECMPAYNLVIRLLFYCGVRPEEISRLRVSNLRLNESVIYLQSDQTKNQKEGYVTIPDHLIDELRAHIHGCPAHYYVFSTDRKLACGPQKRQSRTLSKIWGKMRNDLGLDLRTKLYSLKDTSATWLAGIISPNELKEQMRHHSLSITDIYIQRAKPMANPTMQRISKAF